MLFIDNKYTQWYHRIITTASTRVVVGYSERHHIIPRSLGGTNHNTNLVKLTAREHFICHVLLTKMLDGENKAKMLHAVWTMANRENDKQQRYAITGRMYQYLKEQRGAALSISMAANNPMRNPIHYETHKQAIKVRGKTTGTTGLTHTEETKDKMRSARMLQVITEETKQKLSAIRTGSKHTDATKQKMAESHRGSLQQLITCPHCGKAANRLGYGRWHGDNCKRAP